MFAAAEDDYEQLRCSMVVYDGPYARSQGNARSSDSSLGRTP
jgi:hypothetical protein